MRLWRISAMYPLNRKKEVGMKLNELKNHAQERINTLKEAFECQDNSAANWT